jgi:hypothetical protein
MMHDAPSPFPCHDLLTARLSELLADPLTVVDRAPNRYASIFLSEIVTCRLSDGQSLRLLCKSGLGRRPGGPSHAGRVAYEASVYRDILRPSHASVARYYGMVEDVSGEMWLVLEYLDGVNVKESPDQARAFHSASGWIGRFHAMHEGRLVSSTAPFLHRHDTGHYRDCARQAMRLADVLGADFSWLAVACQRFEEQIIELLAAQPETIIHGDYFADNIIYQDGSVFPIDWEWAAVGVGEVDIACLTENWPPAFVAQCLQEYRQARWPDGSPTGFERVLDAVRLYLCLAYLRKPVKTTGDTKRRWRLSMIRSLSEKLGIL